ncbi:MAG TPA: hypothetical protein VL968_11490 [Rhodocyclaceae bacterium]|nr:hypothetical protein [Rhodocyclaceae bacterium]
MQFHILGQRKPLFMALLGCSALLSGCVTGGYHEQVASTVNATKIGAVDVALSDLEQKNPDKDKDLLYFLEKGELLRMKGSYPDSRDNWLQADTKVRDWEEAVKTDPSKLMGDIGSFLINDTTRRYDGRDYEKVLLSVRLALDHLALGDWGAARVEIKKMHEREAIIAEYRSKELDEAKKKSEEKGLKATSFKELNGYPVETLDAPEVRALKNSYESAIANYLAGFVYESLGESSLAAAGYRKAIEMRPGEKLLEDGLKSLDKRASQARNRKAGVDTLVLVETGNAPAITSRTLPIPLPLPTKNGVQVVMTPISWPVVEAMDVSYVANSIGVDDKTQPLTLVTSVDPMARRAMADEMPGIIIRSSVRAIAKGAAQKAIQDNTASMGIAGSLLSIAAGVAAVVSEKADERTWRTLPGMYSVARINLPPGSHKVSIGTPVGTVTKEVQLSGNHAVVVLRSSGNALYVTQTPYAGPVNGAELKSPESLVEPGAKPDSKTKGGKKKSATATKKEGTT